MKIKQVIVWGHKLHSHTHSYIHNGFFIGFNDLGFKTHWFDDNDNVKDFDFTCGRNIHNGKYRRLIHDWDSAESWTYLLELEKWETEYTLIFSVAGGDYDIPFCSGWASYDFIGNVTNTPYPKLVDHLENEYFGFNALINSSVLDADGKFVFLIQQNIKSFDDIIMLDYLRNDIDDLIMDDDILLLVNNAVKNQFNENLNNE
jgi:hypothetical protein